ncbi:PorV/PorQ family protein [bacterium]|nr:PorV/PorQ family protein [bacterium]
MNVKKWILLGMIAVLTGFPGVIYANGAAGTMPVINSLGVGARQLGLGGAGVALPSDASTLYWNPAALEYLQQANVNLFYTNLLGGANYGFIGAVYPTLGTGTVGIGFIEYGVDGIIERDDSPYNIGEFGYTHGQFLFSYGKIISRKWNLSAGASVKMEYENYPGLSAKAMDSGFGVDAGLYWRPPLQMSGSRLSLGVVLQNIVPVKLKSGETADQYPINTKLGIANTFDFVGQESRLTIAADLGKADKSAFQYNLGAEFSYKNLAMFRMGYYNAANEGTFVGGFGFRYQNFSIDYAFSPMDVADFVPSHRFSCGVSFGKTKRVKLAERKARRLRAIRREVANQQRLARRQEIEEHLQEGRRYLKEGDYVQAQIEFQAVLKLQNGNQEARKKSMLARKRFEEEQDKYLQEKLENENVRKEQLQLEQYIREHWEKGLAYYERKQYENAINEWNMILAKDPHYQLALEFRDKAVKDLHEDVQTLIHQADQRARAHEYMEAIRLLEKANAKNKSDMTFDREINLRISRFSKALNSEQFYRRGLTNYENQEYSAAAGQFQKALSLEPNNPEIKDYYDKSMARASATTTGLPPEMKQRYFEGLNLSAKGQYSAALKIFEEILERVPNSKRVLTSIDKTKEKINSANRRKNPAKN